MMVSKLDLYDKKILYQLDIDARTPASEIAKKIRLPKETVNYRIKRLIKNNYIQLFYALINSSKIGYTNYMVFLLFEKLTPELEQKVINYIRQQKSTAILRVCDGSFDFIFLTKHKTPAGLQKFLIELNQEFGEHLKRKSIHTIIQTRRMNQKFLFPGRTEKSTLNMGIIRRYKLDKTNIQIIRIMANNARISLVELAEKTGLSARSISYRIKKLEKQGIITGYHIKLNMKKFRRNFIQIDISLKNAAAANRIAEYFDSTKTCLYTQELIGRYDLSIELSVQTDEQLRKILRGFRKKFFNDYIFYDVNHVYKEYTIDWSPFEPLPDNNKTKKRSKKSKN